MNGSGSEESGGGRGEGRAPAGLVLVLVGCLAAAGAALPARAQSPEEPIGPPTLLAPAPETPVSPAPAAPPATVGGGAAGAEGGAAAPAPESGIAVEELGTAETDYGGPLQPGAGGFGLTLWQGSTRARVTALLPRLPVSASPAMQQLARRLLLSAARPPEGPLEGPGLIGLRAERLFAMGRLDDARSLVAAVPSRYEDAAVGRVRLDLAWLAGDLDGACAAVDAVSDPRQQDAYWQKSLIFCQLRRGQVREAQLGLDLLREQGDDDPAFAALVDRLAGGHGDVQPPAAPTPLQRAMMRAAGVAAAAPEGAAAPLAFLVAAARDDSRAPAERLAAAEEAALMGALPVDVVRALYLAQPATPTEIDSALALADTAEPMRGRALLYQAADRAGQAGARATLVEKALERARRDGTYALAAAVNLPFIENIPVAPELSWFAATAVRALVFAGRQDLAARWAQLAEREAPVEPQVAADLPRVRGLLMLAGGMAPQWDVQALAGPDEAAPAAGPAGLRAARLAAVAAALAAPAGGPSGATPAPGDAAPPDPRLLADLDSAAAAGRLGETVLLALVALGPEGPGGTHPEVLRHALSALAAVGLDSEVRRLAVEAAVANGV